MSSIIVLIFSSARVGIVRSTGWPSAGTTWSGLTPFLLGRSVVSILSFFIFKLFTMVIMMRNPFWWGDDKCRLWLFALSVNLFAENVFVEDKFILAEFFVWRKIVLRKIVWQKNVLHNIVLRKIFWEHLLQKIFLQKICLQKSFCGTFNQAWVGYILPTQAWYDFRMNDAFYRNALQWGGSLYTLGVDGAKGCCQVGVITLS